MSLLQCVAKTWDFFWRELSREKRKRQITWTCSRCGAKVTFNPETIWVGGYGPRQGWAVIKIFRSVPEIASGKKIEYKLCPECVRKLKL